MNNKSVAAVFKGHLILIFETTRAGATKAAVAAIRDVFDPVRANERRALERLHKRIKARNK